MTQGGGGQEPSKEEEEGGVGGGGGEEGRAEGKEAHLEQADFSKINFLGADAKVVWLFSLKLQKDVSRARDAFLREVGGRDDKEGMREERRGERGHPL